MSFEPSTRREYRAPPVRVTLVHKSDMRDVGTVKWFDEKKGYGFISSSDGEVFLHKSIVFKYGIRGSQLVQGVRVKFNSKPSMRTGGLEVTAVAFV